MDDKLEPNLVSEPLEFWLWTVTDPFTKRRRRLAYMMTEATARERFGEDAVKVEGSLEVRQPIGSTSAFQRAQSGV